MSIPKDILSRLYPKESDQKLYPKEENSMWADEILNTNIYNVMLNRRSQRTFSDKEVEDWKIEIILACADTAPTAGGFQGFEVYHIKNSDIKKKLVEASNNQPYVNSPLVLVFCMNPARVKMNFPEEKLKKFSLQDATLAASYSQLAAHALELSTIWIGMIDEQKVMEVIGTNLVPACILCMGYPKKILNPKPKRSLSDLVHTI